jgi:hypothetical protein
MEIRPPKTLADACLFSIGLVLCVLYIRWALS